jgi:hypothetical protein
MKLLQLILLTTVMSSLAATCLSSKALALESDDLIPHYEIEVIIYKNTKVPTSQEYTLPISSPIKDDQILDLSDSDSIEAAIKKHYEVVPEARLQLNDMVNKIKKSSRYEVLKHFAWRQPGLDQSQVLPLWIKAGRHFGNEFISIDDKVELLKASQAVKDRVTLISIDSEQNDLNYTEIIDETSLILEPKINGLYEVEGKITVSLSRYLHVYTDLVLRKLRNPLDPQLENTNLDSQPLLNENLSEARILDNYALKEHRRMRSETLHYLDSPGLSMLIIITPYEIPVKLPRVILQKKDLAIERTVIE